MEEEIVANECVGPAAEQLNHIQLYGEMGQLVPSCFCYSLGDVVREVLCPRDDILGVSGLGLQFGAEKKPYAGLGLQDRTGLVINVVLSISRHCRMAKKSAGRVVLRFDAAKGPLPLEGAGARRNLGS